MIATIDPKNEIKVGLFSPSEPLGGDRGVRIELGLDELRNANIEFKYAANAKSLEWQTAAGTIKQRISDIEELLNDDDVNLLLATWGGKACNQLLPFLPYELFKSKKKCIAGFSDVAVLLNAITAKTGLITYHGPNVAGKLQESEFSDFRQLRTDFEWGSFNFIDLSAVKVIKSGVGRGKVFGGNLNCFVLGLMASGFDLSFFDGGVFFFEDLGLTPRLLEQYLVSMRNAGFFDRISGVVIGQYETAPHTQWMDITSEEIVSRVLENFEGPIVSSPFFGHSSLPNPIIPIGAMSVLNTDTCQWLIEG